MGRLKLGILGGTFDPPHIGHVILTEFAQRAMRLDQVLFVPAGDPPHKAATRTSTDDRLQMLRAALAGAPTWSISRVDIDRPGPHYTVDMVRLLQGQYPQADLHFIMGADSFRDLPTWRRPQDLVEHCRLIVMQRPNIEIHPDMHAALIPALAERTTFIDAPLIGVSSSDIVRWLAEGMPVHRLLAPEVYAHITQRGLYL